MRGAASDAEGSMDSASSAAICVPRLGDMDAQENDDPNHGGAGPVAAVAAVKLAGKAATAPATPRTPTKLRRPLQRVDCNSAPLSAISHSACPPSRAPVKLAVRVSSPLCSNDRKPRRPQSAVKRPRSIEEATDKPALTGAATVASRSPVRVEGDGVDPEEALKNENLAWMDMMLALLEKKYGPQHAIPMSLAELEDAEMLRPRSKKRRTSEGGAEESAVRNRNPAAELRGGQAGDAAMPAIKTRAEASRLALEREEKEREERRRLLLLRHAQQIQDSSMRSSTSCGCKKGCLKMYCVCFSSRGFCHSSCSCDDCKNSRASKEQRLVAIQSYLASDPRAFAYASQDQTASTTGLLQLLPQKSNAVVQRGCRCKKSKCLKKYCECFQNGIACTAHCRCVDCSNHSEAAHRSESAAAALHPRSSMAAASLAAPFHPIHVTVTKMPRRNRVRKSIRLSL